jgi:hypothetical protein
MASIIALLGLLPTIELFPADKFLYYSLTYLGVIVDGQVD